MVSARIAAVFFWGGGYCFLGLFRIARFYYKNKVGDLSRGWPDGSLFNSYYIEVLGRALLHSLDCSTLSLIRTLWCWVLSKEAAGTIFFFESLVWIDLGLNPCLPDYWRTYFSWDQWLSQNLFLILHFVSIGVRVCVGGKFFINLYFFVKT